ncbi:MAG TPA: secondary thiamine-phosphate synthase enzyme YjbQ [Candidatus Obscuribacterales bacterium]
MSRKVATSKQKEIVDLTDEINQHLGEAGFKNGLCHVFALHTTCAITTADLDPGTDLDMLDAFEAIIPKLKYRHPHNPEHVPDHIMSTIIGPGVIVPVTDGELRLGTWQRVILVELDGPRKRDIEITLVKA